VTQRTFPFVRVAAGTDGGDAARRADIEVSGLEHGGPSYELRIFLANAGADHDTPPTQEHGYAGSIHVYGMGMPPDPATSQRKTRSIIATDAVRAAAAAAGGAVGVTLVAVPVDPDGPAIDLADVRVAVLAGGASAGAE
jgi:hypothetical protein